MKRGEWLDRGAWNRTSLAESSPRGLSAGAPVYERQRGRFVSAAIAAKAVATLSRNRQEDLFCTITRARSNASGSWLYNDAMP